MKTTFENTNDPCQNSGNLLVMENEKDSSLEKTKRLAPLKKKKSTETSKAGRKRILSFEDLEDPALIEKTKKHIQELADEVKGLPLISLKDWCEKNGINSATIIRLFNDANMPVIRLGDFLGVYELHLTRVFEQEIDRQVQQQIRNRVCASILTYRQHQQNAKKAEDKEKKKEKIKTNGAK